MIPLRFVKKIELGPRQMTFGFEEPGTIDLDFVYSVIEKQYQDQGSVPLHGLIESQAFAPERSSPTDILPAQVLQAVFWLAEELKVHLYTDNQAVTPFQAKQALLQTPDKTIRITINQPVDQNRFDRAKKAAHDLLPPFPDEPDQYIFSRAVAQTLESWHTRLSSFQPPGEQTDLVGKAMIHNSLVLIDRLLEKKDSHAIILALVKYQSKLPELCLNVQTLSDFYTRKLSFWTTFAQQMQDFEQNMEMIRDNPEIHCVYRQLTRILNASSPFDQVGKAQQLLPELKTFHNRIEKEKEQTLRKESLEQIDRMIGKLSTLFDTFDTEDDYRNNTLHELRTLRKKIDTRRDVAEIKTLFNDAKDLFVDTIENV